jgi:hypothetical protein
MFIQIIADLNLEDSILSNILYLKATKIFKILTKTPIDAQINNRAVSIVSTVLTL